jgi:hypothetical protein
MAKRRRVYVLTRTNKGLLRPMVFSTFKKAKDYARTHHPFATVWIPNGRGYWEGRDDDMRWEGEIDSVPVDSEKAV